MAKSLQELTFGPPRLFSQNFSSPMLLLAMTHTEMHRDASKAATSTITSGLYEALCNENLSPQNISNISNVPPANTLPVNTSIVDLSKIDLPIVNLEDLNKDCVVIPVDNIEMKTDPRQNSIELSNRVQSHVAQEVLQKIEEGKDENYTGILARGIKRELIEQSEIDPAQSAKKSKKIIFSAPSTRMTTRRESTVKNTNKK